MSAIEDKQIAKEILIAMIQSGKISENWTKEIAVYYETILATISKTS